MPLLNIPRPVLSKGVMFFTWTPPDRDALRWRFALYSVRIIFHKRLVLALTICGALLGALVSALTPKVYAAHVVVDSGMWEQVHSGIGSPPPAVPFPVWLATELDAAASWLRLPDPKLASKITKWLENNQAP